MHATYCLTSALSLLEFCDYVYESEKFDSITFQLLTSPIALNVFAASPEIKQKALEQLDLCIDKYEWRFPSDITQLVSIRESLNSHINDQEIVNTMDEKIQLDSWINELETKLLNKDTKFNVLWNIENVINIS